METDRRGFLRACATLVMLPAATLAGHAEPRVEGLDFEMSGDGRPNFAGAVLIGRGVELTWEEPSADVSYVVINADGEPVIMLPPDRSRVLLRGIIGRHRQFTAYFVSEGGRREVRCDVEWK